MSHKWEIHTSDGRTFSGENDFPNDIVKNKAIVFILELFGNKDITIIPSDCRLVFIRRNRIDFSLDGNEQRHYFYIVGYKGKEKKLYKISVENGVLIKKRIETDGRSD